MKRWEQDVTGPANAPGDGSAWEELVRQHHRRVFNICYRFTGNRTEAEDFDAGCLPPYLQTLASYRSAHGGFATWMTSVTRVTF